MKTFYLVIASILLVCTNTNAQTWQWTHPEKNADPFGNIQALNAQAHDVEIDASGNIYVLGDFDDSLFLSDKFIKAGGGSYLAKYDSTSKLLWHKLIVRTYAAENVNPIRATDLIVNATGVYITGKYWPSYYDDVDCGTNTGVTYSPKSYSIGDFNFISQGNDIGFFLAKFNPNGKVVWNKTATHPTLCVDNSYRTLQYYMLSNPILTSDKKNNIISGFVFNADIESSISIGSDVISLRQGPVAVNSYYLVVAKYNSSGNLQWSNYAGGGFTFNYPNNYDGAVGDCFSLVSDNNNNIFFSGSAGDSTFFGSQLFRGKSGFASGTPPPTFISKISSAGVWQFAKELSNGSIANPNLLCADDQNNIYALLNYGGSEYWTILKDTIFQWQTATASDFGVQLLKMNNNGNLVWRKGFVGLRSWGDQANGICFANNSLYITGVTSEYSSGFGSLTVLRNPLSGSGEYFVAKTNINGDFQWVATAGSSAYLPYSDGMEGLAVRAFNDNIYTAGYYVGGINTLGNLNGTYPGAGTIRNIFFGKLKDQYIRVGAVTPTTLCPGSYITIPFTSYGLTFSNKNKFTAEISDSNGDFTLPVVIGTKKSTGTGSITATIPASLTYGSGYRVRIRSSDTLKTGYGYYAYADTGYKITLLCPAPSTGFAVTNITATSATLNWAAVGCASGYKVQYRKKGTTAWTTAPVITTNTPAINLTGLIANTIYQWRVATRCKNNGTFSFSAFSAIKQFTTAAAFAVNGAVAADATAKFNSPGFAVYPNPANSNVVVQFTAVKAENYIIELTDVLGKVLQQKRGNASAGENKILLDISKYGQGIYMINLVNDEQGKRTIKLNKE